MLLQPRDVKQVPELTAFIAHSAFPKGHPYITLRDKLGPIYEDVALAPLFSEPSSSNSKSFRFLTIVL